MKKIKILIAIFTIATVAIQSNAQDMWGTTSRSKSGSGAIFRTNGDGEVREYFNVFPFTQGRNPYNVKLVEVEPNTFYGTTGSGGDSARGTIYKYNAVTEEMTVLHHFGTKNGTNIQSGLLKASNGKLYGVTASGGSNNKGTLYEFDPSNDSYKVMVHFMGGNGVSPIGLPMQASNNRIYGTTSSGGTNGTGVIYEFDITTRTSQIIHHFSNGLGSRPRGNLVEYNGALYGLATQGGSISNNGLLFSLKMGTFVYSILHNFSSTTEGNTPEYIIEKNGILYGNCRGGGSFGGTLFKYDIGDLTFSTLHMFTAQTGRNPSQLSDGHNGFFYGVTDQGGLTNQGVFYKISLTNGSYVKIADFNGRNARFTKAGVLKATNGKYYFSSNGGLTRSGNILEYDTTQNTLKSVFSFNHAPLGGVPVGKLLQVYGDKFIGITSEGGNENLGTVYIWDPSKEKLNVLHHLTSANGRNNGELGGLVKASNGNIYGVMHSGGVNNRGTVYTFDLGTSTFDTIKSFHSSSIEGSSPVFGLVEKDGYLYGLNYSGSTNGKGSIFKINMQTNVVSLEFAFKDSSGGGPKSMVLAKNGKLYGVNTDGGWFGDGTLWEYNFMTKQVVKLRSFEYSNSGSDAFSLVEANPNYLMGVNTYGGNSDGGVLYGYDLTNSTFRILHAFIDTVSGNYPNNELHLANNGNIYGLCSNGGASRFDAGTVFEWDVKTQKIQISTEFNVNNGYYPEYGGFAQQKTLNVKHPQENVFFKAYPNPSYLSLMIDSRSKISAVAIFNLNGQEIESSNKLDVERLELNLSAMKAGVYILKVLNHTGELQSVKFVKQ